MWKIILAFVAFPLFAALPPFKTVALVEAPAERCLALELDRSRLVCVTEFSDTTGDHALVNEVKFIDGKAEKRQILELRDTSNTCRGSINSVSRFFGFESKDVNGDGRLDPVLLVRAGKLKRRGMRDGECAPAPIGTAIYEVSYVNQTTGLEAYEPSYPVLMRLRSLNAVQFAE